MAVWKPIVRLGLGWLIMLAGMALLLDSGIPASRPRSQFWPVVEALGGLALVIAGWLLRRAATKLNDPR